MAEKRKHNEWRESEVNGLGKEQAGWEGAGGRQPLPGMHTVGDAVV